MAQVNLFNFNSVLFDFQNPNNSLVESKSGSYDIIGKKINPSNNYKDRFTASSPTLLRNSFIDLRNQSDNNRLPLHKYLFLNKGLISDYVFRSVINLDFDDSSIGELKADGNGLEFGLMSFCLSASSFTNRNISNKEFAFPRIPQYFFSLKLSNISNETVPSYTFNLEIKASYLDIFFNNTLTASVVERAGVNLYQKNQILSSDLVSLSNYDNIITGTKSIVCRKTDRLELIVRKETIIFNQKERTRYIFSVKNLNDTSINSQKVLRSNLEYPIYKSSLDDFRVLNPTSSESVIPYDYVDRAGVYDTSYVSNNNQSRLLSLNPVYDEFSVDIIRPDISPIVVISDSVGLGYGTKDVEIGRSFVSELKRTTSYNFVNLSKYRLHYVDVNECIDNIQLITPSSVILGLGYDTVGRIYYRHDEYIENNLTRKFLDFLNKPQVNSPEDTFIGRTYHIRNQVLNNYTLRQSDYTLDNISLNSNYYVLFKNLYDRLKFIGVSDLIVLGMTPIPSGDSEFYTERLFSESSLINGSISNFYLSNNLNDLIQNNLNVKTSLINYSNLINQNSISFDYFINLRSEFGNSTFYLQQFKVLLTQTTSDDNSIYFGLEGHLKLVELISNVLENVNTSTLFTQNQRQLDVRIGLTKSLNSQIVYAIDQTHNFPVLYDAKLDINLYNTLFENDGTIFSGFKEIKLASNDLYDFFLIVPFLGQVSLLIVDLNNQNQILNLAPNRPTMMFIKFKKIFLRNEAQKEIPLSIILGKMK